MEASSVARTCVVTRQEHAPADMIRFVLAPDGVVTPDVKRKLPGRGVWVKTSRALVEQAIKRQAFARGFKDKAAVPPSLADQVEALLQADALQALAIANKAGQVVTGFAKVEATIANESICGLVHAADGGADGKRKLRQALSRRFGAVLPPEIGLFSSAQLDLALGRSNVIHAALKAQAAAKVFLASCRRLAVYRGLDEDEDAPGEGGKLIDGKALEQDFKADCSNGLEPWDA